MPARTASRGSSASSAGAAASSEPALLDALSKEELEMTVEAYLRAQCEMCDGRVCLSSKRPQLHPLLAYEIGSPVALTRIPPPTLRASTLIESSKAIVAAQRDPSADTHMPSSSCSASAITCRIACRAHEGKGEVQVSRRAGMHATGGGAGNGRTSNT